MDPYLEQFWGDVHTRLILYSCDQLQTSLPGDLRARVQERVFVESPADVGRSIYPDVRVVEQGHGKRAAAGRRRGAAVAEPVVIRLTDEPVTEHFIEILDISTGRRLVTVIEVLSPSNKRPGPGQEQYLEKQQELLGGRVSLVEIDLLRAGRRVYSVPPTSIPLSHRTPYQVVVRRGWDLLSAEVYAVPLRQRLPTIKVPLRQSDGDVTLDLQAVLEQGYRNGGYDNSIDYEADPVPPLPPDDADWAATLLRRAGLRRGSGPRRPPRRGGRGRPT
jgi:hypothetical protein